MEAHWENYRTYSGGAKCFQLIEVQAFNTSVVVWLAAKPHFGRCFFAGCDLLLTQINFAL